MEEHDIKCPSHVVLLRGSVLCHVKKILGIAYQSSCIHHSHFNIIRPSCFIVLLADRWLEKAKIDLGTGTNMEIQKFD